MKIDEPNGKIKKTHNQIYNAEEDEENMKNKDKKIDHHHQEGKITTAFCNERKSKKKKALMELRSRVEDAILGNYLLGKPNKNPCPKDMAIAREQLKDITLWGVPLLPSKSHEGTDIILLKFLKAKDFKVHDAFEMLQKTLNWRKEYNVDRILEEQLGPDHFQIMVCLNSEDRTGYPLFYNAYEVFNNKELYDKTFGTEEKREEFLRWRIQAMEKGIGELSFKNGGVDSTVHIMDLNNLKGPYMKELSSISEKALILIQNNYPNLVYKNIVINVPFWFYARHALRSMLFSHNSKAKFVFVRPSKVTKTLLQFIAPEDLPVQFGGLKREEDVDFSSSDKASELIIRANTTSRIELPAPEAGVTMVWDVNVMGWEVSYKEEFEPEDEGSYKIMLHNNKKMKMGRSSSCVRNSFYIGEPGKIVITIDNGNLQKEGFL